MYNIKIGLAFILGWFMCGLFTPHLMDQSGSLSGEPMLQARPVALPNATKCAGSHEVKVGDNAAVEAPSADAKSDAADRVDSTEAFAPRTSSRCEFLWDASARCRRPPFKAFDISKRANLTCMAGGPLPPVVVIAALPRSGSSVLKTALEFATGVRVGMAAEGQCNARMFSFIESTYPYRRENVPASCSFWLNKNVRTKPNVANVWGVVVIVRSPYRWIDDLFSSSDILPVVSYLSAVAIPTTVLLAPRCHPLRPPPDVCSPVTPLLPPH
jgi:hypothetical protein